MFMLLANCIISSVSCCSLWESGCSCASLLTCCSNPAWHYRRRVAVDGHGEIRYNPNVVRLQNSRVHGIHVLLRRSRVQSTARNHSTSASRKHLINPRHPRTPCTKHFRRRLFLALCVRKFHHLVLLTTLLPILIFSIAATTTDFGLFKCVEGVFISISFIGRYSRLNSLPSIV